MTSARPHINHYLPHKGSSSLPLSILKVPRKNSLGGISVFQYYPIVRYKEVSR